MMDFLHDHHIVSVKYPVADALAGTLTTDYISLANYRRATFLVHTGVATSGTADATITILAASAAAGTGAGAVAFRSRVCASSTTVDTWGASTATASTGLTMTAGSNYMYACEVSADDIEGADAGNPFVALKSVESTNDPVVAGVICILSEPRYPGLVPVTAIA